MADTAEILRHLDPDERIWLSHALTAPTPEARDHALEAAALVHEMHMRGECS